MDSYKHLDKNRIIRLLNHDNNAVARDIERMTRRVKLGNQLCFCCEPYPEPTEKEPENYLVEFLEF